MARSNEELNAIETKLKSDIKTLNKKMGAKLSYSKIKEDFEEMFTKNPKARDEAIRKYTNDLKKQVADVVLTKRSEIWSNRRTLAKNEDNPIMDCTMIVVSENVESLMRDFCDMMQEDYNKNRRVTNEELKALRNWDIAELNRRTYFTETPLFIESWSRGCFRDESKFLDEQFIDRATGNVNYQFQNEYDDYNSSKDIIIADAYYKAETAKAELEKHGFFWRLFNFRKVAACNDYIAKVADLLPKLGFDVDRHRDKAIETLKNTIAPPHKADADAVVVGYGDLGDKKFVRVDVNEERKELNNHLSTEQVLAHEQQLKAHATEVIKNEEELAERKKAGDTMAAMTDQEILEYAQNLEKMMKEAIFTEGLTFGENDPIVKEKIKEEKEQDTNLKAKVK